MNAEVALIFSTAEALQEWGAGLGSLLQAGDLLILTGGLGAGKTTLTQGIARGLGVRGPITSPTFVISRTHPSLVAGPPLVHVDAYRLDGAAELDDIDLDTDLESAVTIVEWGSGIAESLSEQRLELELSGEGARAVVLRAFGDRFDQLLTALR
ncbi:MAG: tRNA (adenosine(37)-N6)-threonylcarbamoyltransferase complex ATPase subunit type 1 TsaE [Allobranchiibius sp.]